MKVLIAGSTGFLGTELVRQALLLPQITEVIALGRRAVSASSDSTQQDEAKLKNVIIKDFENYSETEKEQLRDLNAVIWTIAITPGPKMEELGREATAKISRDYAITALKTISALPRDSGKKPLRWVYISGVAAERDQTKTPTFLPEYCLMRGEAETLTLSHASTNNVSAAIAKPGFIIQPSPDDSEETKAKRVAQSLAGFPSVSVQKMAAALLEESTSEKGFERETYWTEDLERIGERVLKARGDLVE